MMFSSFSGCFNKFQSKSNFWPVLLTIKFVCLPFFFLGDGKERVRQGRENKTMQSPVPPRCADA